MLYQERLKYSAAASTLVHIVALVLAGYQMSTNSIGITPNPQPIVLQLTPRDQPEQLVEEAVEHDEKMLRLIEPGTPTDESVNETDLISSEDSKAQSATASEGDPDKPAVDRIDDFDELGGQPTPPKPLQTALAPQPEPADRAEPQRPEPTPEPARSDNLSPEDGAVQVAARPGPDKPESAQALEPQPELEPDSDTPEQKPQPMRVAQAPSEPVAPPVQELEATRGREDGGAMPGGFTNFEAKQHELGAYMLEVRKHVEREWRTALQMRYAGVGPARAILDCSIRPDGTLEYVRIVDGGNSPGFSTLCKAAIERASRNFPAFPFEVPEIYRSKNLEVRWQFTYM